VSKLDANAEELDVGDKLACGLGYKRGLPNYSSIDFHVSITVTKRPGEADEDFALRGWAAAERELVREISTSDELIGKVRPVQGSPGEYD
jgi:hypothetical protein